MQIKQHCASRDFSVFDISRKLIRDLESKFTVTVQGSDLLDVRLEFRCTVFGRHHFLIGASRSLEQMELLVMTPCSFF